MNALSNPDSETRFGNEGNWFELLGVGIILLIRWPFTSLWKERKFAPNAAPKSEIPYRLLCALGAFAVVFVASTLAAQLFYHLFGDAAPVPLPLWTIWVAVGMFVVLTIVRVNMYLRNEAQW